MNIVQVYKQFPTHDDCLAHLEKARWHGAPICPYCNSTNATPAKNERRYHCNNCNTSFSVTVRTIFHKTHLDLQKWFLAISLILNAKKGISSRQLARDLEVNKDTAWYLAIRIRKAMTQDHEFLEGIVEVDETYIGGKNKPGSKRGRGTSQVPVVGMVERDGKVTAKPMKKLDAKTLSSLIREKIVPKYTTMISDGFGGYRNLAKFVDHKAIDHKVWYAIGNIRTNTIESFWSLLKRGIVGQYHKVSIKYLQQYINEFCFRQNYRKQDMFELTLQRAVGVMIG